MTNQDRLLSDEELYEAVDKLKYSSNTKDTVDLINTQKRLYAESVEQKYQNAIHRYEVTRDYPKDNLAFPIAGYYEEAQLNKSKGIV